MNTGFVGVIIKPNWAHIDEKSVRNKAAMDAIRVSLISACEKLEQTVNAHCYMSEMWNDRVHAFINMSGFDRAFIASVITLEFNKAFCGYTMKYMSENIEDKSSDKTSDLLAELAGAGAVFDLEYIY